MANCVSKHQRKSTAKIIDAYAGPQIAQVKNGFSRID